MGTFVNYQIRFRLMDLIRKKVRDQEAEEKAIHEQTVQLDHGNRHGLSRERVIPPEGMIVKSDAFWRDIRNVLTDKQWSWVHYFNIADLSIKEITEIENVSATTVKSRAYEVRKKLKNKRNAKQARAINVTYDTLR